VKFTDLGVSFRELSEPRYLRLSDAAKALHIAMKAWAADQQTDGVVADVALQLIPGGNNGAAIAELVDAGLWSFEDGAFRTDWAGQILAADARDITEKNRRRWADMKRHQRGQHGPWCPKSCTKSSADTAGDTDAESSRSVPNLPGPDLTDPPGIGKGGSGKRRSGARLVGAAALAPAPASSPQEEGLVRDIVELNGMLTGPGLTPFGRETVAQTMETKLRALVNLITDQVLKGPITTIQAGRLSNAQRRLDEPPFSSRDLKTEEEDRSMQHDDPSVEQDYPRSAWVTDGEDDDLQVDLFETAEPGEPRRGDAA
jgi:hypothetical protein